MNYYFYIHTLKLKNVLMDIKKINNNISPIFVPRSYFNNNFYDLDQNIFETYPSFLSKNLKNDYYD